jgi:hypothetical protein
MLSSSNACLIIARVSVTLFPRFFVVETPFYLQSVYIYIYIYTHIHSANWCEDWVMILLGRGGIYLYLKMHN